MSPILFTLYVSKLEHVLAEEGIDCRQVEDQPLPVLLYVDNTVLMAKTARRLQALINAFVGFIEKLDLSTNISKSHVMIVCPCTGGIPPSTSGDNEEKHRTDSGGKDKNLKDLRH
ncbi:hypothetical protein NDU88_010916 [Pleurodeles waltl]|uniref:Reverse transcriptase domain-containing protein n=1 Tax=Pleurodeles waltl TaxID=8319 RepID=A0AAV7R051_PLEWA|nr:hypothetical protein NDU88_010916 [Pleurodeles waltl]